MSDIHLGRLIIDGDAERDAIHVAIAPVVANHRMVAGQRIGLIAGTDMADSSVEHQGIVDPFLSSFVDKGERCWMFLFPNTVTGMRHHWSHPAFERSASLTQATESASQQHQSIQWMEEFADAIGLSYEEAIDAGHALLASQWWEGHVFKGRDTPDACYANREDYWRHFEVITGQVASDEKKEQVPFSCSCS